MPPGVLAAVCWQTTTLRLFQDGFVGFPKWFRRSQGSVSSGLRAAGEISGQAEPRLQHWGYFPGDIGGSSTKGSGVGVRIIACGGGRTRPRGAGRAGGAQPARPRPSTSRDRQEALVCVTRAGRAVHEAHRRRARRQSSGGSSSGQARMSWRRSVDFSIKLGISFKYRHQTPRGALVCGGGNVPSVRAVRCEVA